MRNSDIIAMGVRNLLKRKARTILTVLGVLIGTAAIIVMLSLGVGMNEANMKAVESIGSVNVIKVNTYYFPEASSSDGGAVRAQAPVQGKIDDKVIAQIAEFGEVEAVTPLLRSYFNYVSGKYKTSGELIGIDTTVMDMFGIKLKEGRLLQAGDTNTVLYGARLLYNFYNTRSNNNNMFWGNADFSQPPPIDVYAEKVVMTSDWSYGERKRPGNAQSQTQKPKLYKLATAGIIGGGENEYGDYDYSIVANIDWVRKVMDEEARRNKRAGSGGGGVSVVSSSPGGSNASKYDSALVKVGNVRDVEAVQKKINEMGLGADSPLQYLKYMEETTNKIQQLLGSIAAVSLLVAAINIANTMIMSVYERTKEIAVMKVLGCKLGNIGQLFLFEAGLIGFFGGFVGVAFSYLISFLLNRFGGGLLSSFGGFQASMGDGQMAVSIIPVWLVAVGLVFATIIGVISGFLPARRAMRLSVLKAIHNE
jgi:ABC-type antimicrobial peptide transport system permease subunit